MEPRVGDNVTPAVRLTRALRRGGMGSVWLAHHHGLDTEVVVKFIMASLSDDELSRERFLREAAAAAKVHSPHVVRIFDHGVTDAGHPFIVMEYLEGEDLSRVLKQGRCLNPEQVAHIVEQTGRALDAAHRRGIIHRDVKPANIFLIDVGARLPHVKLVDFGVAKASQLMTLTSTGELVGTPVYMSPEQIACEDLDHRSDLWSLGVVAFRALTGERPIAGDTVASVAYQVVHARMPHPSDRRPELPRTVDAWFAQACARDPAERFASAREMADALWEAIGMPQAASSRGDSLRSAATGAERDTLRDLPRAPTAATRAAAGGDLQPSREPTAGSLQSSVATVTPAPKSRWRNVALFVGIPLALAAGYAVATLRPDDPSAAAPNTTVSDEPLPAESDEQPRDEPRDTELTATASAAAGAAASASASASASAPAPSSSARVTPRPPARPVAPADAPDDLGF